jgi:hypothetical protein
LVPFHDAGSGPNGATIDVELDSWATVQQLAAAGFTVRQAEVITDLFGWILRVRLSELRRTLVNQPQAEYVLGQVTGRCLDGLCRICR